MTSRTSCIDTHLNRTDKSTDIAFLDKVFDLIKQYYTDTTTGESKVIDFKLPQQISSEIDFTLYDKPTEESKLIEFCEKVLSSSVRCTHPFFFNQLFAGVHPYALAGQFISSTQNGSMFTYEIAPVYSIMERQVCLKLAKFIGWDDTDSILAPGGSICNLYGMLCARHKSFPNIKTKGMGGLPNMVVFSSEHSHYSVGKFAILMGIGTDNIIKVKCDEDGRMCPENLRHQIVKAKQNSSFPICVVSTIGTTVLGAIDPIDAIANVCIEFGIWHHVDGCLGAPVVLVPDLVDDVRGIEKVDSVAWDAHKLWTVPLQCSAFLANPKHKGILLECNSMHARYLFQQDKQNYDPSLDTGDKSIQCGRHIDVFKLWLWWKGKGTDGVVRDTEICINNARLLANMIEKRDGFEMIFRPQFIQVCFFYIPPGISGLERNEDFYAKLDKVAAHVKSEMVKKGDMMIGYQKTHHPKNVNYWRMVLSNPATNQADLVRILDHIEELGKDMF